jgi:predicted tellurium resistance membrane protein TerC
MLEFLKKFTSIKVWCAVWAAVVGSYIVFKELFQFDTIALACFGIVFGYMGFNVGQDWIFNKDSKR